MDNNVLGGIIRAILPPAFAYAIGAGLLPAADYGAVITAIVALATAAWSVKTNRVK
jgi:hypothetical protein